MPRRRAGTPHKALPVDPGLYATWTELIALYYPDRRDLLSYQVSWARRRQKRTLGCCNLTKRKVSIAQELRCPDFAHWVEAVLYHELCHAVLGTEAIKRGGRRAWHGTEFKQLEARHPNSAALQDWMRNGGWLAAVRSARSRAAWAKRAA
ncbi:MAG: SprT-like domain-containing protein [Deltaproteobacteria bacterium]|nr:SprT-like domain-containing protein [Deltaproteobacteria bacterium]